MDLMQHGDDFLKIELLSPAKSWYKKALELNIESEKVEQKITECDLLLILDIKVFKILAAITTLLMLAFLLREKLVSFINRRNVYPGFIHYGIKNNKGLDNKI